MNRSINQSHGKSGHTKKKYKIYYGRLCVLILSIVAIVFICSTLVNASTQNAEEKVYTKRVTNYEIKNGDTLWGIAEKYASDNISTKEYVNELMRINNLTSSKIIEGRKIIVFYYVEANQEDCHLE